MTKKKAKEKNSADKKTIQREDAITAITKGEELAELRGLNKETIDFIYAFSALNYQRGKYEDAARGFRFLCRHKHRDPDMWLALARAQFAAQDRLSALKAYLVVAVLRPSAALCLEIARAFMAAAQPEPAQTFLAAAKRALLPSDNDALRSDISKFEKEFEKEMGAS